MPVRVGFDLVDVDSVLESIEAFGDRYLQRVYSRRELADCFRNGTVDPARLAARLAAKEATFKALQVGEEAVSWAEVEVRLDRAGSVELCLSGRAATLARAAGVSGWSVSLTHECGCAAAVVVAEISAAADER
jgi:holo-[acyl-carrier protein] synthase